MMMMMMMSSLKLVLIFGMAFGVYYLNAYETDNLTLNNDEQLIRSVGPLNTNITDHLTGTLQRAPGFDYFLFVLQWPGAFCNIQRNKPIPPAPIPGPRLCKPYPLLPKHQNKFTVHGLWPQLNGGVSPLYCSPKPDQYMTDDHLDKVKKDLLDYWPDLFDADNLPKKTNFWIREWRKHGKCSIKTFKPQQYLRKTLDLAIKYAKPIFDELKEKKIIPDGTTAHGVAEIRQVVMKFTGYNPIINVQLNDLGDHLLLEIQLCVKKDGVTLMNCDPKYKFAAP